MNTFAEFWRRLTTFAFSFKSDGGKKMKRETRTTYRNEVPSSRARNGFACFCLFLLSQIGVANQANADDFCQSNLPAAERINKPIVYQDFQSGWIAFGYSKESIENAIQAKNSKQLLSHLQRVCQVSDGLKAFSEDLDEVDGKQLLVGLNQVQGVLAAMDSASKAADWAKFAQLQQQFSSVYDSIKDAVPPCWRAPLRGSGKRAKLNLARNTSCR